MIYSCNFIRYQPSKLQGAITYLMLNLRNLRQCPAGGFSLSTCVIGRRSGPASGQPRPDQGHRHTRPKVSDGREWCCQTGLNCRPLHYQWSALPLSYGSMPGQGESAQTGPLQAAGSCHKDPSGASTRRGQMGARNAKKSRRGAGLLLQPRQLRADPVPRSLHPRRQRLQRANSDLESDHFAGFAEFDPIDTPQLASCRSWRKAPAWHHQAEPAVQHPLRPCMWFARRCILPVLNVYSNGPAMKDDKANRDRQISSPAKDSRQDRLKLALRENLKRRKSQARGRSDAVGASSEDADTSLDDGSGKEPGR
jgi:hypothetical protein